MKELFIAARSFILSMSSTGCWKKRQWPMQHYLICKWWPFPSYTKVKITYLWRFPEWPPDPCGAVQSLGDSFAGAHSTHGVLWQLPSLHRDSCNKGRISTVASGWPCSKLTSHSFTHSITITQIYACTHTSLPLRSYTKWKSLLIAQ